MSSARSYPRCAIEIRASRQLFLYSILVFVTAVAAPWLAGMPAGFAAPVSLAAVLPALSLLRWARGELRVVTWLPDGRWMLTDANGIEHEDVRLLHGIFLGQGVLILHWRCIQSRRGFRVALMADNCDEQARRRLAVRLRIASDAELFPAA
ncbi:MAG TPA: protein YgfX [Gammaproteobacteria bacterium]